MDDSVDNPIDPESVDWWSLNRKLLSYAAYLFRGRGCSGMDSVLPNTGMSAIDLTGKIVTKLMEGTGLDKVSDEKGLYRYAREMLWNDFLDLVKSAEYERTIIMDSIDAEQDDPLLASLSSTFEVIEAAEAAALVNRLQSFFNEDMAAQAYLRLWLIKGMKRDEIAHLLGLTNREVTDIRRRVLYKIKSLLSEDAD